MNKNIEDIIKDALDNHDAGYVTGAWEKMSARLDGTPPTPFYKKWWMAAAFGTVLVGSAAYFLSSENEEGKNTNVSKELSVVPSTGKLSTTDNEKVDPKSTGHCGSPVLNVESGEIHIEEKKSTTSKSNDATSGESGLVKENPNTPTGNQGNPELQKIRTVPPIIIYPEDFKKVYVPTQICANEDLLIVNPNTSRTITVTDINGKTIDLAPGKKITLTPKSQGTITVQSGENKDFIAVHENTSKLYIDYDMSLLYENGIPTMKFKVPGMKENLMWSSNVKGTEQKGETYIVHPYTDKNVEVKVTSMNEYGCEVSETQQVSIKEPYNLMAPSGFRPNSGDIQTNTFMPYALTQRNVNFELIVLDPRTGAVIFSSSDATIGWNGVDGRTGEMVKENSVWAWKVVIKNPNVGEPVEYKGTITRM